MYIRMCLDGKDGFIANMDVIELSSARVSNPAHVWPNV